MNVCQFIVDCYAVFGIKIPYALQGPLGDETQSAAEGDDDNRSDTTADDVMDLGGDEAVDRPAQHHHQGHGQQRSQQQQHGPMHAGAMVMQAVQ